MNSKTNSYGLPGSVRLEHAKFLLLAIIATVAVPLFYVLVALAFTGSSTVLGSTAVIAALAVLLPTGAAYAIARLLGPERAARWTAIVVLLAGTVVGWATVFAFRV